MLADYYTKYIHILCISILRNDTTAWHCSLNIDSTIKSFNLTAGVSKEILGDFSFEAISKDPRRALGTHSSGGAGPWNTHPGRSDRVSKSGRISHGFFLGDTEKTHQIPYVFGVFRFSKPSDVFVSLWRDHRNARRRKSWSRICVIKLKNNNWKAVRHSWILDEHFDPILIFDLPSYTPLCLIPTPNVV